MPSNTLLHDLVHSAFARPGSPGLLVSTLTYSLTGGNAANERLGLGFNHLKGRLRSRERVTTGRSAGGRALSHPSARCRKGQDSSEIEAAFAALVQQRAGALVVGSGPYFVDRRAQLIALAAQHAIPTSSSGRESTTAGGLMGYGNVLCGRLSLEWGIYVGRILKRGKPGDLPVDRSTKFELVSTSRPPRTAPTTYSPAPTR